MTSPEIIKAIQFIDEELKRVEQDIRTWVYDQYRLPIQVSIQLILSSQALRRSSACNETCKSFHKKDSLLSICNDSDTAMKVICNRRIDQDKMMRAIGYLCHQKLSNVVVPYADQVCIKGTTWYIFLGQFYLIPCPSGCKNGDNLHCEQGLEAGNMFPLEEQDIISKYKGYFCPGMYAREKRETTKDDVSEVTLPQVIAIKVKAIETFSAFLSDTFSVVAKRQKLIKFVNRYSQSTIRPTSGKSNAQLPKAYNANI